MAVAALPSPPSQTTFPAATIYVARHGESVWNAARRVQGQTDVPLSNRGREQAVRLGQRLADEPLDGIFTSDLARARDTGMAVVEAQRRAHGVRPPLHVVAALRERDYGGWEGKSATEVRALREHLHREHFARSANTHSAGMSAAQASVSPPDAPPDGESFEALVQRLLGAWNQIATRLHDTQGVARVLVVGHGAALRGLLCGLTDTPAPAQARWQMENAALSRLRWVRDSLHVDFWNDVTHLAGLPGPAPHPPAPSGGASR
jgi:2,3-bisphosphoglycerate-dependent phosphoglycerate mutase